MVKMIESLKHGPASETLIVSLESHIGFPLPEDYKTFLREHNGGHPEPNAFYFVNEFDDREEDIVDCFFPLRDIDCGEMANVTLEDLPDWPVRCAWDDLQSDYRNIYEQQPERQVLPIGTDGSSNYIAILLEGDDVGSIVFFEHEMARVSPLADSFDAFLEQLHEAEE